MLQKLITKRQSICLQDWGTPNKIKSPIKAIIMPSIFLIPGLSLNKKYAIITPNGTSV